MKTTTSRSRSSLPVQEPPPPPPAKGSTKFSPFAVIVVVIVLGTAAVLMLSNAFHGKGAAAPAGTTQAVGSSDPDVAQLIQQVAKHIVVNTSEQPTVATIQDANLLRTQNPVFYKDAQNGDRLLIWSDKAVLYSPSRDVLLAVLPVSLPPGSTGQQTSNPAGDATTTAQAKEQATIEVRNGAPTPGLGSSMASSLKAAGFTVLPATDAKSKNYPTTVIVKANAKVLPQTLAALEAATHASVVDAPASEGTIKGDFLVIVGADYHK